MVYYTQLLKIREGKENDLRMFEDATLSILQRHEGRLLCLAKLDKNNPKDNWVGFDELHVLSFGEEHNFKAYMSDPERQNMLHLKKDAVEQVLLIEGTQINP